MTNAAQEADRKQLRSTSGLLANPHAILRVPIDASREDVALAFDDRLSDGAVSESDLKEARRQLLAPKLRIQAIVEFMPDANDLDRANAIGALIDGRPLSDLISLAKQLPPFSRVTLLSNLAQIRPSSGALKYFALSRSEVDQTALIALIAEISEKANIPRPQANAVAETIDLVTSEDADRLFSAYADMAAASTDMKRCLEEGLPKATDEQIGGFTIVVDAYDRKTSSSAHFLRRQVEDAAEHVQSDPEDRNSQKTLFDALRAWDALVQPQQMLAQQKGRDHSGTRDLFQFLRRLMLELANERDAVSTALAISKVCLEVFAELPRAVQQLREDESSLQDLVDQAGLKDLQKFLELSKRDLDPLASDLNRYGFSRNAPGLSGQLFTLFEQSLEKTRGTPAFEFAWVFVRILALDINNDLGEGSASERLIAGLRSHPNFSDAPAQLRAAIEADCSTLKANALQARLSRALEVKDRKQVRTALVELAASAADPAERLQYQQALDGIDAANNRRVIKYVIWGVILLAVIGYSFAERGGSRSSKPATYRPNTTTTTAPESPVERLQEVKPAVGTEISFTRGNLRYCLYLSARLDAIRGALAVETNSGVVAAFNREVDDYNARCASFRYYPDDLAAINREVASRQATLADEGRRLLQSWRAAN